MKSHMHRRGFLKTSILGATAAMVGSTVKAANDQGINRNLPAPEAKIQYRSLGKTGIRLPVVSMGVMRADNPNLVKAALNKGIVHFDTANGYQKGNNETMLGEVFQEVPRDKIFLSTKAKLDGVDKNTGAFTGDTNPDKLVELLETSLQRLKFNYVDILYLHDVWSAEAVSYKPVIKILEKLKKEGKIRFAGVSTHRNMAQVIRAAVDNKFLDVVLAAYNFQMMHDREIEDALAYAGSEGLGIIAMKTLAGGFLDRERTRPVNTRAALKWALKNENVCTAIPGFTSFAHLDESFSVMEDLNLTPEEMHQLEADAPVAGLYCQGCERCLDHCPKELPIPDLMRAYMYTYGYHDTLKARELLGSLCLPPDPCVECETCLVTCSRGFRVNDRIRDVVRLQSVPLEFLT
jgi:uncharacterized protein